MGEWKAVGKREKGRELPLQKKKGGREKVHQVGRGGIGRSHSLSVEIRLY